MTITSEGAVTVKPVPGQPPSSDIRAELVASGRPVLLAFSRGKDAIATWLALRDAGMPADRIIPYDMYLVPGLRFIADDLDRWCRLLGAEIHSIPHPSLIGWLNAFAAQTPERVPTIIAAGYPDWTYEDLVGVLKAQLGVPVVWTCDGVRAADSPERRVAFADHGVWKQRALKVSPIYDWTKGEVMDRIAAEGWELPPDYPMFGRSFDGIDYRFVEPLSRHAPADFAQLSRWFPLISAEIHRRPLLEAAMSEVRRPASSASWQDRKRAEKVRYDMATDGEFYLHFAFDSDAGLARFDAMSGGGEYVDGARLPMPAKARAGFGKPKLVSGKSSRIRSGEAAWIRRLRKAADPFAGLEYGPGDDLARDLALEMDALLAAFPADDNRWRCVYFATRRHKLDFLAATGLDVFGERYMPGEKALTRLGRAG